MHLSVIWDISIRFQIPPQEVSKAFWLVSRGWSEVSISRSREVHNSSHSTCYVCIGLTSNLKMGWGWVETGMGGAAMTITTPAVWASVNATIAAARKGYLLWQALLTPETEPHAMLLQICFSGWIKCDWQQRLTTPKTPTWISSHNIGLISCSKAKCTLRCGVACWPWA